MGKSKKLLMGLFKNAVKRPGYRGYLKKIIITAVIVGVVLFIGTAALIGYSISQVNSMIADQPILELVALERLVNEKVIVLTQEQKEKIAPLLRQLGQTEQISEQSQKLKNDVLAVLDSKQLEMLKLREQELKKEAAGLLDAGRSAVEDSVNKYTGISIENGGALVKSISAWWQVNFAKDEVPQNLLKQIESSQ